MRARTTALRWQPPLKWFLAGALRRYLVARRVFVWTDAVIDGWHIRVRRGGRRTEPARPAVVLLAGLGLSGRYLLPLGAELAERFEVWVPDLPSHGRRDGPPGSFDLHELADIVVAWMDEVGLGSATLVGNSMGCQVAVEAAVRHPARVSGIVLEGPTIDVHARSVLRHIWRIALDGTREPPSLTPIQVSEWLGTGPVRLIAAIRHAFAHEMVRRLPLAGCPALVVRGGRDPVVPQRWAEQVAAMLPDAEFVLVPEGAHAMTYSEPRVLAELVEEFVLRTSC